METKEATVTVADKKALKKCKNNLNQVVQCQDKNEKVETNEW